MSTEFKLKEYTITYKHSLGVVVSRYCWARDEEHAKSLWEMSAYSNGATFLAVEQLPSSVEE